MEGQAAAGLAHQREAFLQLICTGGSLGYPDVRDRLREWVALCFGTVPQYIPRARLQRPLYNTIHAAVPLPPLLSNLGHARSLEAEGKDSYDDYLNPNAEECRFTFTLRGVPETTLLRESHKIAFLAEYNYGGSWKYAFEVP